MARFHNLKGREGVVLPFEGSLIRAYHGRGDTPSIADGAERVILGHYGPLTVSYSAREGAGRTPHPDIVKGAQELRFVDFSSGTRRLRETVRFAASDLGVEARVALWDYAKPASVAPVGIFVSPQYPASAEIPDTDVGRRFAELKHHLQMEVMPGYHGLRGRALLSDQIDGLAKVTLAAIDKAKDLFS